MKTITKTPLNKVDISNLIDLALENKMPWNVLAYILKDTTSYDPKQVIENLLKALENLHSKMLEKDHNYEKAIPDEKENVEEERFNEEALLEAFETNKVDHVEIDSSIEDHRSMKDFEAFEDDSEALEIVDETMDEEMSFDHNEKANDFEETVLEQTSGVKDLSIIDENKASVIENEWYVFVTSDKESEPKTVVNTEMNIQGKVSEGKKSFQCMFCKKQFRDSCYMKRHERIHTG